jgi:hypothetical protein
MLLKPIFGVVLLGALLAVAEPAEATPWNAAHVGHSVGRFRDGGYATLVPSRTVYYYDYYQSESSCESMTYYYGYYWDSYVWNSYTQTYGACYANYKTGSYIYANESLLTNDLLFWEQSSQISFTALLLPDPDPTAKIHTGICSSGGGSCSYIWNNTAEFDMPSLHTCSQVSDFTNDLSYELAALRPGHRWGPIAQRPETSGRPYFFRPTSAAAATASAYMSNPAYYGASYGGSQRYNVGGAAVYSSMSVCSESAATAFGMSATEGRRGFAISYAAAGTMASNLYANVYSLCRYGHTSNGARMPGWSGIDGSGAGWCVFTSGSNGRDGTCRDMANAATNAAMGVYTKRRQSYGTSGAVHAISGTTVTPQLFAVLNASAGAGGELGRISYWSGKVNVHKAAGGSWVKDSDCASGSSISPLTYCRKFWPTTASVTQVSLSSKSTPVWNTGGCGAVYGGNGVSEYTCNR